jgi:hypothetical protein
VFYSDSHSHADAIENTDADQGSNPDQNADADQRTDPHEVIRTPYDVSTYYKNQRVRHYHPPDSNA